MAYAIKALTDAAFALGEHVGKESKLANVLMGRAIEAIRVGGLKLEDVDTATREAFRAGHKKATGKLPDSKVEGLIRVRMHAVREVIRYADDVPSNQWAKVYRGEVSIYGTRDKAKAKATANAEATAKTDAANAAKAPDVKPRSLGPSEPKVESKPQSALGGARAPREDIDAIAAGMRDLAKYLANADSLTDEQAHALAELKGAIAAITAKMVPTQERQAA